MNLNINIHLAWHKKLPMRWSIQRENKGFSINLGRLHLSFKVWNIYTREAKPLARILQGGPVL